MKPASESTKSAETLTSIINLAIGAQLVIGILFIHDFTMHHSITYDSIMDQRAI